MNAIQTHNLVRKLFEDTAELVWRHKLGNPPPEYDFGVAVPSTEEIASLKQRTVTVSDVLATHTGAFRIARDRLTNHDPLISGVWLSRHEWVVNRCRTLLNEVSNGSRSSVPHDDVFDETVYAAVLAELAAEASAAVEIAPLQKPDPSVTPLTNDKSLDARALAILLDHRDWNKTRIAKHLKCVVQNLAPQRCPKLTAAIKALRHVTVPRGSKGDGRVEAWQDE